MKKEMLINVAQPEESRIAVMEDGRLGRTVYRTQSVEAFAGNIYRGKIVNLEPSIQAAFVDFGVGRNGFLHISDVEPPILSPRRYDPAEIMRESMSWQRKLPNVLAKPVVVRSMRSKRPTSQQTTDSRDFQTGDEVLVQVIKEGIGTKAQRSAPTSRSQVATWY